MAEDRQMAAGLVGVILAGGQARRMGGSARPVDKGFLELGGQPLLDRVLARGGAGLDRLLLSAAGPPTRFAAYGLPVLADSVPGRAGPLAGILSALEWMARGAPAARWLLSLPCDTPFLPRDLAGRLRGAAEARGAAVARAMSAGRPHPVIALWRADLAADLRQRLAVAGERKIDRFTARHELVDVPFDSTPIDPFFNINRPADLAEAEKLRGRAR